MSDVVLIAEPELKRLVGDILLAHGMASECAEVVAMALVWADMRGISSHGVTRLKRYLQLIERGEMNPTPHMSIAAETASTVVFESDRAPGPFAMMVATDAAIARARGNGIGLALARATTHTAALGYYTEYATRSGMVAIAMAGSIPNMAYFGSRAAGVSTGGLAIAAPGGDEGPIALDMASAVVSLGKLAEAAKDKLPIPPGWALDLAGNPTTDASKAAIPQPMGGPKGAGLSLMIEVLTGLLGSNPILADAIQRKPGSDRHRQNGLIIAIDLQSICNPASFAEEVARLRAAIRSLPRADETQPILLPGERSAKEFEISQRSGVRIASRVALELSEIAARAGVRADCLTTGHKA